MAGAYWIDVANPVIDTDITIWYTVSPDGNFIGGTTTSNEGIIRTIDGSEPDVLLTDEGVDVSPSQFNLCNDRAVAQRGDRAVLLTKTAPGAWDQTILSPLPGFTNGVDCLVAGWGMDDTGRRMIGYMQDANTGRYHAILWDNDTTPTDLGLIDGFNDALALAISGDGNTIVGYVAIDNANPEAFIWTEADGMQLLSEVLTGLGVNLSSYILQIASSISANGKHIMCNILWDTGYSTEWRYAYVVLP